MSHSSNHASVRFCDVAVVGGSAAGLAAALQVARQRRSVIVIDSGEPRNAPARHMHGFLTRDGVRPSELMDIAREEVRSYGGEVLTGRVADITRAEDGLFRVDLGAGTTILARRVIAATGVADELPDIAGLAEQWGRGAVHCPFCHGYEVRDQRLVLIVTPPMMLHAATLFRQLSEQLTIVFHDPAEPEGDLDSLRRAGVNILSGPVMRIVSDAEGAVVAVELAGDRRVSADAVVVSSQVRARAEAFRTLGVSPTPHPSGIGTFLAVDEAGGTGVPGLYAAGSITNPSLQVLPAAADGSRVGAMVSFSLAEEDLSASRWSSGNETDWNERYSGEAMWSGNPNGTLVREVSSMRPGRVLDVGAGEGGDAVWLAQQGWIVTASDVSQRGLDRVAAAAQQRGVTVTRLHRDANALHAFEPGAFDLVSAQYSAIPRTRDGRGLANLLDAVAPGGTLLVVGHDLHHGHGAQAGHEATEEEHSQSFDPAAYLQVEDFAGLVAASPDWTIELHETRPRPPGAASGHHVSDVVFRARRNNMR